MNTVAVLGMLSEEFIGLLVGSAVDECLALAHHLIVHVYKGATVFSIHMLSL